MLGAAIIPARRYHLLRFADLDTSDVVSVGPMKKFLHPVIRDANAASTISQQNCLLAGALLDPLHKLFSGTPSWARTGRGRKLRFVGKFFRMPVQY